MFLSNEADRHVSTTGLAAFLALSVLIGLPCAGPALSAEEAAPRPVSSEVGSEASAPKHDGRHGETAPPPGAQVLIARVDGKDFEFIRNAKARFEPRGLRLTFETGRRAKCRASAGLDAGRPHSRRAYERDFSRQHSILLEGRAYGRIFVRLSGWFETGGVFHEGLFYVDAQAGDGKDHSSASADSSPASPGETGGPASSPSLAPAEPESDSPSETASEESATGEDGACCDETSPGYDDDTRCAGDDESEPDDEGNAALSEEERRLKARAASASEIERAFGPASLPPERRRMLVERVGRLLEEYREYQDAQGARALAKAYLELRHFRKALQYATEAVSKQPDDCESLGIRLQVFRTFGMGWKVRQTYERLLELRPGDKALASAFERDKKLFGDFRGIGRPVRVELK